VTSSELVSTQHALHCFCSTSDAIAQIHDGFPVESVVSPDEEGQGLFIHLDPDGLGIPNLAINFVIAAA